MSRWTQGVALSLLVGGCSDQIIGEYSDTLDASTSGPDAAGSTSGLAPSEVGSGSTTDGSDSSFGSDSSSSTGLEPIQAPFVGCFDDHFDDALVDGELWNTWSDPGTSVIETTGFMKFTPAIEGLVSTGIVSTFRYDFDFADGWVRMQLADAPDGAVPVNTYLQVLDLNHNVLSIAIGGDALRVFIADEAGRIVDDQHPTVGEPKWLGLRANPDQAHVVFEVSDDGINWTTIATHPQPGMPLQLARALVMVETAGDNPTPQPVTIDRVKGCFE